jgi:glucose-1-phosphate adenylyltransferase
MFVDPSSVVGFVMAGGEGARLRPLTSHRCKPALPFHGEHRVVDFVLSNLANSGIGRVYLLVQYKAPRLIEHIRHAWARGDGTRHRPVTLLSVDRPPYRGTADAVARHLNLIEAERPAHVAVFGADHIYRMDVAQMLAAHVASEADATVATVPVPASQCHLFGIVRTDERLRIQTFREKPPDADGMHRRPGHALASMGNYIFRADVLVRVLRRAQSDGLTDFGRDVLPRMLLSHRVFAYDFTQNRIPGLTPSEDPAYWRDIGTLDAYFMAHMETLRARSALRPANPAWPIRTGLQVAAPALVDGSRIRHAVLGASCLVDGAALDHVVLGRGVRIDEGASLEQCVVMEGSAVGCGARIRRAIVDDDNAIPAGERIGFDPELDHARFPVSEGGVIVVPRGHFGQTMQAAA